MMMVFREVEVALEITLSCFRARWNHVLNLGPNGEVGAHAQNLVGLVTELKHAEGRQSVNRNPLPSIQMVQWSYVSKRMMHLICAILTNALKHLGDHGKDGLIARQVVAVEQRCDNVPANIKVRSSIRGYRYLLQMG